MLLGKKTQKLETTQKKSKRYDGIIMKKAGKRFYIKLLKKEESC